MKTLLHTRMTHMVRNTLLPILLVVAAATYGGVPAVNVIVSDASDRVVFKGATNANATFETGNLRPGQYVVQFKSKAAALNGNQYLLVVAAGKKKVIADAVSGEKFNGGGVAMRVDVGPGLKITGQMVNEDTVAFAGNSKIRVINGVRYVWVTEVTGSNLGPHWVAVDLPRSANTGRMSRDDFRKMMDTAGEGSMLNRYHGEASLVSGGY